MALYGLRTCVRKFWYKRDGELVSEPLEALAIPFWSDSRKLLNLQYRIIEPPDGFAGKYRWASKVVPFVVWRSGYGREPLERLYIVEGAIKGMVLHQQLREDGRANNVLVLATSQNRINHHELPTIVKESNRSEKVIYIPDPDMEGNLMLKRNINDLRISGVEPIVLIPEDKIDDMIVEENNRDKKKHKAFKGFPVFS